MGTSNGSMVNTAAPAGAGEGPGAHASGAQCVRIRHVNAISHRQPRLLRLARKCAPDCGAPRQHAQNNMYSSNLYLTPKTKH